MEVPRRERPWKTTKVQVGLFGFEKLVSWKAEGKFLPFFARWGARGAAKNKKNLTYMKRNSL